MEVIGGGGELEGGGVVAVDRDHWCGRVQRCRRVACLCCVEEKPEKETILGKTYFRILGKGYNTLGYNTIPCLQTSPQS
jgi:hypothetical protein